MLALGRKLRVLSVCRGLPSPDNPSSGVFVLRRLQAMESLARVSVIQPFEYFPVFRRNRPWQFEEAHDALGTTIRHEKMFSVPKVLKFLDGYWMSRSIERATGKLAKRPDIIDAHFGYPEGVGAALAGQRMGIPAFVTFRGFEAEYLLKPLTGRAIRASFANLAGCVCVSHFLKDLALEHGANPDHTTVIHNAIDRQEFRPGSRLDARAELGLDAEFPVIVSVGHLIPRKRHNVLVEAFARISASQPGAKLFIIGGDSEDPDCAQSLKRQTEQLGVADNVRFMGNIRPDQIATWLRAADLFALATQREGCCNAILEALAVGVPVVTTPVGDNQHFVKDGSNGFIVPVDDAEAMAIALQAGIDRTDWSPGRISSGLAVGSWVDVGRQVMEFMEKRLTEMAA